LESIPGLDKRLKIRALGKANNYSTLNKYRKGRLYLMLFFPGRVTRTLFAFAELTKMDPAYSGPPFDYEKILGDLISQVKTNYQIFLPVLLFLSNTLVTSRSFLAVYNL
jgi:hypothetical protein